MKLGNAQRIYLLVLLPMPEQCNHATYQAVSSLRQELGFSEKELAAIGLKAVVACPEHKDHLVELPSLTLDYGKCDVCHAPRQIRSWKWQTDCVKDAALTPAQREILRQRIQTIDVTTQQPPYVWMLYDELGGEAKGT